MRKLIAVLFLLATTASFGQYEVCRYKMVAPVANETLVFSDSLLKITFDITPTAIKFMLWNNAEYSLSVLWDECSVTSDISTSKVIHKGISYDNMNQTQSSTRIPPAGMIEDFVIPTSRIYKDTYSYTWKLLPIVTPYSGYPLSFFMVLKENGKEAEYNFKFVVTEVLR